MALFVNKLANKTPVLVALSERGSTMERHEPERPARSSDHSVPVSDDVTAAGLPDNVLLWVIDILEGANELRGHGQAHVGYQLVKDALYVAEQAGCREAAWAPQVVALYRRALEYLRCPRSDQLQDERVRHKK